MSELKSVEKKWVQERIFLPEEKKTIGIFEARVNKDKCKGCMLCVAYCPVKQFKISTGLNKKGHKFAEVNEENKCVGCGFCFAMCPDTAIEVVYAQEEGSDEQ